MKIEEKKIVVERKVLSYVFTLFLILVPTPPKETKKKQKKIK